MIEREEPVLQSLFEIGRGGRGRGFAQSSVRRGDDRGKQAFNQTIWMSDSDLIKVERRSAKCLPREIIDSARRKCKLLAPTHAVPP